MLLILQRRRPAIKYKLAHTPRLLQCNYMAILRGKSRKSDMQVPNCGSGNDPTQDTVPLRFP